MAGALLFDEKIHQSTPLFRLGFRNDGIPYQQAAIQRTIDASPAFMEYGLEKKIAACAPANREPNKQEDWIQFCMKRLRTLKLFQYSVLKLKNQKHIAVNVLLKGFSMVPLSCRSNLAGRYL